MTVADLLNRLSALRKFFPEVENVANIDWLTTMSILPYTNICDH
jgi:hypothetical protein